ncbi:MAG TPA: bile acid:sodium symporter [Verrucomicrobiae bacterium]|nr:bile acid:sodium symporter [Verrucomicrobiae bacterium]
MILIARIVLNADAIIQSLTTATLVGLLFSSGLQLTWNEIADSLRKNRIGLVLAINFIFVPTLTFALTRAFQISTETTVGMMLLAAAPFAPVVPTFTRLAKGDLALAAALTGLFPVLSAFLTPLVCEWSLRPLLMTSGLKFDVLSLLLVLVLTITLPLAAGVLAHHCWPVVARKLFKPIQVFSETIGTISLIYVTTVEFHNIVQIGWKPLLAMVLASEISFAAGYFLSRPPADSRLVVALGTANRNIALALLIAVESFPGTPIKAMVVANGLLLILLGLLHVGLWRLLLRQRTAVKD